MDGSTLEIDSAVWRKPRGIRILLYASSACLAVEALHNLVGLGGSGLDSFFNDWVYNVLLAAAAAACLARGVLVRAERVAWLAIGAGIAAWTIGEVYWTLYLSDLDSIPYPSLADGFYLGLYPGLYAGIVLLLRQRVPRFDTSFWLDGAIGALATAAVGSAILYPAIQASTGGDPAAVATNLAYPLGDLLLLSFVVGVLALTGWRPGRTWLLIASGLVAQALADGAYLYAEATGGYIEGGGIDSLWLLGTLILAFAAWHSPTPGRQIKLEGLRLMLLPSSFALAALMLLARGAFSSVNRLTLGLAAATLFVVVLRMVISFNENLRLIAATERASRAKSDFLAKMSHELRTPLTAIVGFSEIMQDVPISEEERAQFTARIVSNGRHLQQLINDLLDLSKVEAGMMRFHPVPVDLRSLVDEVVGTMRVLANSNHVKLRSVFAAGVEKVVADRAKLKQVLYNYLSNAVKFTPPGGEVTLSLHPEDDERFRVTVEDTGIGIKLEDQYRLFHEFEQVGAAAEGPQPGTGLGLALVKRIVEAQGGSVGVQSTPGVGSVFFAVLPRTAPAPALPDDQDGHTSPTQQGTRSPLQDRLRLARASRGGGRTPPSRAATPPSRR